MGMSFKKLLVREYYKFLERFEGRAFDYAAAEDAIREIKEEIEENTALDASKSSYGALTLAAYYKLLDNFGWKYDEDMRDEVLAEHARMHATLRGMSNLSSKHRQLYVGFVEAAYTGRAKPQLSSVLKY
jgi:hypothetical protein